MVKGTGAVVQTRLSGPGVTIVAGNFVYIASDDTLALAADDSAAHANMAGVALNGGAPGQPVQYQSEGLVNLGGTLAIGTVYGPGDTPGAVHPNSDLSTGDFVTIAGIAVTAALLQLRINASGVAHA